MDVKMLILFVSEGIGAYKRHLFSKIQSKCQCLVEMVQIQNSLYIYDSSLMQKSQISGGAPVTVRSLNVPLYVNSNTSRCFWYHKQNPTIPGTTTKANRPRPVPSATGLLAPCPDSTPPVPPPPGPVRRRWACPPDRRACGTRTWDSCPHWRYWWGR